MKPGWATTEFWQTTLLQGLGVLVILGVVKSDAQATIGESIVKGTAAVFTLLAVGATVMRYITSRTVLKTLEQRKPGE